MQKTIWLSLLFSTLLAEPISAQNQSQSQNLTDWLISEKAIAQRLLFANIEPQGTAPGIVIASPSRQEPNYYFHWVRDASIAMDQVVQLLNQEPNAQNRQAELNILVDFVQLSQRQQQTPNLSGAAGDLGLGEPKFNVDGSPYMQPWGRPQNDGPALRALTMIHFARFLIQQGEGAWVQQNLFGQEWPAQTVVKLDLEFVAHHWSETSFDLWEEVRGLHFFTRMVQRRALLEGALLAQDMGDSAAAQYYRTQAQNLSLEIEKHWNGQIVQATLSPQNGTMCGGKSSGLDVAVILGSILGCAEDGFFCPGDARIMQTASVLSQAFAQIYPINSQKVLPTGEPLGVAIGRYPEDCYSGRQMTGKAGPWFLATLALAELYQRASGFDASYAQAADAELRRVRLHTSAEGSLSEQFNPDNGYMQSARDLSWSYAGFLSAVQYR